MSEPNAVSVTLDVFPSEDMTSDDYENLGRFLIEIAQGKINDEKRERRVCQLCGHERHYMVPDECLGNLPGVRAACCGHGNVEDAYVSIGPTGEREVNFILHGQQALDWMKEVREAIR